MIKCLEEFLFKGRRNFKQIHERLSKTTIGEILDEMNSEFSNGIPEDSEISIQYLWFFGEAYREAHGFLEGFQQKYMERSQVNMEQFRNEAVWEILYF